MPSSQARPFTIVGYVPVTFPVGATVTLAELEHDPHPVLARLREHEPVSWVPALQAWIVTRRDLALQVMRDAVVYTVDDPRFSTAQVVGPSMLSLDGDEHRRHRDPFARPFRLQAVNERFSEIVRAEVDRLISLVERDGRADLRGALAGPLSVELMVQALGLEETDPAEALAWYGAIVAEVTAITAGAAPDGSGREAFARLCSSVEPALDRQPSSSLVAAAAGTRRADPRAGGLERRRAPVRRHRDDGGDDRERVPAPALEPRRSRRSSKPSPALLAGAVEESLRLEPAAAVVDRYVTRDTELAGVQLAQRGPRHRLARRRQSRPRRVPRARPVRRAAWTTSASRLASPTALTCASACTSRGSRRAWRSSAPSHGCRGYGSTRLARLPPRRSRLPQAAGGLGSVGQRRLGRVTGAWLTLSSSTRCGRRSGAVTARWRRSGRTILPRMC